MSDHNLKAQFDLAMSHIYKKITEDKKQTIEEVVNFILRKFGK
jgi:hypothetical protein